MDNQLTYAMHVIDRYTNVTSIDKLTNSNSNFDWILVILYMLNIIKVYISLDVGYISQII